MEKVFDILINRANTTDDIKTIVKIGTVSKYVNNRIREIPENSNFTNIIKTNNWFYKKYILFEIHNKYCDSRLIHFESGRILQIFLQNYLTECEFEYNIDTTTFKSLIQIAIDIGNKYKYHINGWKITNIIELSTNDEPLINGRYIKRFSD